MAGSPVKGLDDAAVDEDPGRGGGRSLRGGHEFIHSLVSQSQSYRAGCYELESVCLKWSARPHVHSSSTQPFELCRGSHTEGAIAYVKLARKGQYAGPACIGTARIGLVLS